MNFVCNNRFLFPPLSLTRADGTSFVLAEKTAIMGILNITPNSFFDGGRYESLEVAFSRLLQMIEEGADIIDIGAESTRPGAASVSAEEEWRRLEPLLSLIASEKPPVVVSIDTRNFSTLTKAAQFGVSMANLPFPQEMIQQQPDAVLRVQIFEQFSAIIVMHSRGTPENMLTLTNYDESKQVYEVVADELEETVERLFGSDETILKKIVFDGGIGFAKTPEQSLKVLMNTKLLTRRLNKPIIIGASRKSFLGHFTGLKIEDRLIPSVVAAVVAAEQGAAMVRVHDVKETRQALMMMESLWELRG